MAASFAPTPHKEAAAAIRSKPALSRSAFDKLLPDLRGRALTITGVESVKVMERVRESIASLAEGRTWDEAKADIAASLDPWLGEEASGERATLLLRTHGFQAFQAANWEVAQSDADTTHLQYLATEDDAVRDSHLALNGLILPKTDPFWDDHYPPWDWGCRCRVRPMNPDMVEMERKADRERNPDARLVMDGPALEQLRNGSLLRDGRAYNVTAPANTNVENAYSWHPSTLRIPVSELKRRFSSADWRVFEDFARRHKVGERTLWDWLN